MTEETRKFRINIIFLLVSIIFAYYFAQLRFGMNLVYENASPAQLVAGTAELPYQFRVLIPWTVGAVMALPFISGGVEMELFRLVEFSFLFVLAISFRAFLMLFWPNLLSSSMLTCLLFYVLPFNTLYTYWYPYDIPAVAFFVLGLILLYRQQWAWYYPLFILATLNRETSLFLTGIFILTLWGKMPVRQILGHVAAQLFIWLAIKAMLQSLYPSNMGSTFQLTFFENLQTLFQSFSALWLVTNWGMLWVLVLVGWRKLQDPFLQRALLIVHPFLGIMFVVGQIDELRIYTELIPLILAGAILTLITFIKQEQFAIET